MRKIKTGLGLLVCFFCVLPSLSAQKGQLRKAKQAMETLRYEEAIERYSKVLAKDEANQEAVVNIAHAYRKTGQLGEAEKWYARSLLIPDIEPIYHYYYGQVLLQNGECEAAQLAFREFLLRKPYDTRRAVLEDICNYQQALYERGAQRTTLDHPDFNGPGSDIGPAFYSNGLIFGSVRSTPRRGEAYYDLYYTQPALIDRATQAVLSYDSIRDFSSELNSELNEAIITFSPDKSEVYFTRNQQIASSGKYPIRRLEVLMAQRDSLGRWTTPKPLHFNDPAYSSAHPALSPDGMRLFFSSDRPGGFGGKDIYVCRRFGPTWGSPINLGPTINTEGDELYPFFHTDGELYFSSDGHPGLGGQDIFRSEDLSEGSWSRVDNLGYPINSPADDFGLIIAQGSASGYLTSNRPGGAGHDDIYAFRPRLVRVELQLAAPKGEPLAESVSFSAGNEVYRTNEQGQWGTWLVYNDCFTLELDSKWYQAPSQEVCATTAGLQDTLYLKWNVEAKEEEKEEPIAAIPLVEKAIKGQILDEFTDKPIDGADIRLFSEDCSTTIQLTTDEEGRFLTEWESDCCYELQVSKNGYFNQTWPLPLCVTGQRVRQQVSLRMTPYRLREEEGLSDSQENDGKQFQVGTKTYEDELTAIPFLLNIYYDLGRASVRPEAIPELRKLYNLLVENPDIILEIGSHTDSRGPEDFNRRLSQRRANAIVQWLISKGIDPDRLQGRGYGEERLVNDCSNGKDCSEEEHQMNRRTEFRVIGEKLGQN